MMEKEIQDLMKEIDRYKQVIQDAEDALDAAVQELEEALAEAVDDVSGEYSASAGCRETYDNE